jgi:hypothetical protein
MNNPARTRGSESSKLMTPGKDREYSAKSTRAASAAEPMAYPLVTALVVLPTASRGSVMLRISSGSSAISAMPPALSVMGP